MPMHVANRTKGKFESRMMFEPINAQHEIPESSSDWSGRRTGFGVFQPQLASGAATAPRRRVSSSRINSQMNTTLRLFVMFDYMFPLV